MKRFAYCVFMPFEWGVITTVWYNGVSTIQPAWAPQRVRDKWEMVSKTELCLKVS